MNYLHTRRYRYPGRAGVLVALLLLSSAGIIGFVHVRRAQATTYPVTLKMLVVLVNFADAPGQSITPAQAQSMFFTAPNSLAAYELANSNGRIILTGDVVGPYTITRTDKNCESGYAEWSSAAIAAAKAAGVNPSNYSYAHYLFTPHCTDTTTPGWGDLGFPGQYPAPPLSWAWGSPSATSGYEAWQFGYFYVATIGHEFGHNLGEMHASTPTDQYGEFADVMGNFWNVAGYLPMEFNAPHRVEVGWLDPGEMQTVTSSGTFTLNSLESNTGLRILEIAKPNTAPDKYYISMRQATGVDANMPAAYLGGANITIWDGTLNNTLLQRVLNDGATYTDSGNGITITQVSHTASSITLNVVMPGGTCMHSAPTVTTSPASSPGMSAAPGGSAPLAVTIKNNDTSACAANTYALATSLLSGWTGTFSPLSLSILPGATASANISITNPPATAPSATPYNINYSVAYGATTLPYVMYYYVTPPACVPAAPTFKPVIASSTAPAGTNIPYSFMLKNNDSAGCSASTFILAPQFLPTGWSGGVPPSVILTPGASNTAVQNIASPPEAPNGTTTIQVKVTDALSVLHTAAAPIDYGIPSIPCTPAAPTLTPSPAEYYDGSAGAAKTYTLSVTNNDTVGCAPSIFDLNQPTLPQGWTITTPTSLIDAGVTQSLTTTVTSAATASSGTTTIQMQIIDPLQPLHTATANVKYGIAAACTRVAPIFSITPASQTEAAGAQLTYVAQLTNRDAAVCGPSVFTLSPSAPSGWAKMLNPLSLTVSPGLFQQASFSVTSVTGAADGDWPVSIDASDAAVPTHAASAAATYTVGTLPPPPPVSADMSISATRVHSGGSSTLAWWVSSGLASGITCSVSPTSQIQSGGPTSISGSATITSWGSSVSPITAQSTPITGTESFTLTCSNGAGASTTKSANATLVPVYQDI